MRRPDLVPVVVLLVLVLLAVGGWWLFPRLQHGIAQQDCVAAGHNNCGPG